MRHGSKGFPQPQRVLSNTIASSAVEKSDGGNSDFASRAISSTNSSICDQASSAQSERCCKGSLLMTVGGRCSMKGHGGIAKPHALVYSHFLQSAGWVASGSSGSGVGLDSHRHGQAWRRVSGELLPLAKLPWVTG